MNDELVQLIPFLVPQKVTDGYSMGRGIIRIVPISVANTDQTVIHNLGRIPNFVLILDPGTQYLHWKRGTVAWTIKTVTLQFDAISTVTLWIV